MPGSGFANPGELFTAAEQAGRTVELDFACLEIVAAGAAGMGDESILTLNLSPRTLEADDFSAGSLVALVRRAGLDPTRVVLELTEREQIEEMERLRRNVTACRAAGFRLAADDVGAGNAGLRLLSQLQFDIVKIDLSLVQAALSRSPRCRSSARSRTSPGGGRLGHRRRNETPAQLRASCAPLRSVPAGLLPRTPDVGRRPHRARGERVDIEGLAKKDDWPTRWPAKGRSGCPGEHPLGRLSDLSAPTRPRRSPNSARTGPTSRLFFSHRAARIAP
jgi:hypothetical protein